MQRSGIYPPPADAGPILGVEFAGEIVEAGASAGQYRPGERIFGLVAGGAYAEYLSVDHRHVVRTPASWADVEAAAVIETFCTAHETLFELGQLRAGENVLIHAAGSAVGTAAVQMAHDAGATVIGTAGSERKIGAARQLGATHVVNYKSGDFAEAILQLVPDGVDVIEDFVG
jgi:NADPH:quinone reductase-like Zn-dependent oxidoreductase